MTLILRKQHAEDRIKGREPPPDWPLAIASLPVALPVANTTGMLAVAVLAARGETSPPMATITPTCLLTRSRANADRRSG
jgi:hypothetical protein